MCIGSRVCLGYLRFWTKGLPDRMVLTEEQADGLRQIRSSRTALLQTDFAYPLFVLFLPRMEKGPRKQTCWCFVDLPMARRTEQYQVVVSVGAASTVAARSCRRLGDNMGHFTNIIVLAAIDQPSETHLAARPGAYTRCARPQSSFMSNSDIVI